MTSEHLSEEDLQLLAAGNLSLNTDVTHHAETCESCSEQLAAYRVLYTELEKIPEAVFDFNLEETVLARLQPIPANPTARNVYGFIPAAIAAFVVILSLYKFRKNFINLSAGVSFTFLAVSVVACIIIIGFKIVEEFHRYRLQINKLNYPE